MKKFRFLLLGCCLALLSGVAAQDQAHPLEHIQLEGYLQERLMASLQNRILAQDVDRLVDVFRVENRTETRCWQSEFWGKWVTSAVLAYRLAPSKDLDNKLREAVNGLMRTQTADGYIGNYAPEARLRQWDIWGRKYCLLGLLDYYRLRRDPKVLKAASRLADNLMTDLNQADGIIVTKGNYRGMAASSVLEPIVGLYNLSGQKRYLDFARKIVDQWRLPQGPQLIEKSGQDVARRFPKPEHWYSWEQGQKAYEMMSCYEGLLELYRVTGDAGYRKAVEDTWQNIQVTEINIAGSGASTEMWFGGASLQQFPVHHYQEVCVTVTWIKFCLQLFRLTGEARYAAAAEKAYYNALLGSLDPSGATWAKYTPLNGQRLKGSAQCGMGLNCCEASGPRALFLLPFYAVTTGPQTLMVNFFIPGRYTTTLGSKQLVLYQHTDYPRSGTVRIELELDRAMDFALRLRIPEWAGHARISINGKPIDPPLKAGEYVSLSRQWQPGDQVELHLPLQASIITTGAQVQSKAIRWGPLILARDAAFEDRTPMGVILQPIADSAGFMALDLLPPVENCWLQFKGQFLPESYQEQAAGPVTITLCDYASAGNIRPFSVFQTWFPQLINRSRSPE